LRFVAETKTDAAVNGSKSCAKRPMDFKLPKPISSCAAGELLGSSRAGPSFHFADLVAD